MPVRPEIFRFEDDGETPNNFRLPMILYRSPVRLPDRFDPAAVFFPKPYQLPKIVETIRRLAA